MLIIPNGGFFLSRKAHSFHLRKSDVLFPINKEIHSFFRIPLFFLLKPLSQEQRIYLMAWLVGGCDLFSCHIALFILPPFSLLLSLLHINQRSIV
ncbi:hypothetical protein ZWY2020_054635 [Hordeum vulgare]|nr:hypothetical protein ZWY2020_054635 [Hordeum vulgare]